MVKEGQSDRGHLQFQQEAFQAIARKVGGTAGLLQAILETSESIIFVKDLAGRYVLANAAFSRLLHLPLEEILGHTDADFFPQEVTQGLRDDDARVLNTGEMLRSVDRLIVDGEYRVFLATKTALRDERGQDIGVSGFATEITEQVKTQDQLARLNKVLLAIRSVNQLIVTEKERERLLRGACERLVEAQGYFNAWIALIDDDGQLSLAVESGLGDAFAPVLERLKRGIIPACAERALREAGMVAVLDPESNCSGCPLAEGYAGRAGAAVRLAYDDKVFGFLVLSLLRDNALDDDERSLLEEVAGDLSFALHDIEVEQERQESEELYQLIVENAHSGIILADDQYHLLWVNDQFCEISGWNKAESIGHDFREFLDDESRQLVTERYRRRQRGEDVPPRYEFNLLRKDREKRRVEIRAAVVRDSAGRMRTIGQVLDITERVRAQEQLRAENQMTLALSRSAAAIVSSLDMSKVLDRILEELQRVVRADTGSVMLIEGDTVRVVGARIYSDSARNYDVFGRTFVISDTPDLIYMIETGLPVIEEDTRTSSEWVQLPGLEWQRSYAGIPIRVHDKTLGFLNIDRSTPGPFDSRTIERLQVFASIAGAAIENAALLKEANLRAEQRGVLSELGRDLASTLDLRMIYRTAHEHVVRLLDCDNFAISLFDAKTGVLTAAFVISDGEEIDVSQLPPLRDLPNSNTGRAGAINLRRAVIVDDLADKARRSERVVHVGSDREAQSAIYLPMIVENEVIGLVEVQSYKDHAYNDGDLPLLSMAVNQIGLAIRNAQLFAQTADLKIFNERIVTSLNEGIILENAASVITYVNHATAEMLGYAPDDLVGRAWTEIVPADEREAIVRKMTDRRLGASERYEALLLTKAGDKLPVIVSARPLFDGDQLSGVISVITDIRNRKEEEEKTRRAFEGAIEALQRTTELRDAYTAGHQRRVTSLAVAVAREMGLPEDRIEGLRIAALVHDIGKISVPAEILTKPTSLSDLEMEIIRTHAQLAYDILKEIDFPWPIADIVLQHHERMDGSGYPNGLKGDQILIEARILAVADVVEAMSSHRPYRAALGLDAALDEIKENKGRLYDPTVVDACLTVFEQGFSFE